MSVASYLGVFFGSLALTLISSVVLGNDLDRIGRRLHLSEGLIGLLNALGADAPEIASAVAALLAGNPDMGVGVVLGSNIFNLAGLLGLSALVAGRVHVGRQGLALDGTVAIAVTLVAGGLVMGRLSASVAFVLLCVIVLPYILVLALRPGQVARLALPRAVHRFLDRAVVHLEQDLRPDHVRPQAGWIEFLSLVPAVASVVLGSFGMVHAASGLGQRWNISQALLGTLVLAGLTSLPNMVTALRLALHGRGSAVISETLNSNTLNILAGLAIPALFFPSVARGGRLELLTVGWLLLMTAGAVGGAFMRGGMRRWGGLALLVGYIAFAVALARWAG